MLLTFFSTNKPQVLFPIIINPILVWKTKCNQMKIRLTFLVTQAISIWKKNPLQTLKECLKGQCHSELLRRRLDRTLFYNYKKKCIFCYSWLCGSGSGRIPIHLDQDPEVKYERRLSLTNKVVGFFVGLYFPSLSLKNQLISKVQVQI